MKIIYFSLILFFIFSCNSPTELGEKLKWDSVANSKSSSKTGDSTLGSNYDDPEGDGESEYLENLTCNDLNNRKVIYDLASSEIDPSSGITFDTSDVLVLQDHFISKDSLSTLILIQEHSFAYILDQPCLLLLYNCGSVARLVLSETTNEFSKKDVRDLDGDGVVEIISNFERVQMGEQTNSYQISNFKNGKENILYESGSYSLIESGGDHDDSFKKGDTLGLEANDELVKTNNPVVYQVKEIRHYKICNGGKNASEIVARQIIKTDSVFVSLKTIK